VKRTALNLKWNALKLSGYETILLGVFVILFVLFSLTAPNFLSPVNLQSMMVQMPEMGLIALGLMVVVITAGIDLSITYLAALSGIAIAWALSHGWPIPLALAAGAVTAMLCGAFNALLIAGTGVPPIVLTLGSMILFEGIALRVTRGGSISGFPESYYLIGGGELGPIPVPMLIFAAAAVLTAVMLNRTAWGRSVFMIGNNPTASRFSGIPVKSVLIRVYLFSALMAFLAAVIMTSRYNSAKVDYGSSYLMQGLAAVVLGGTSISGGSGTVKGTVIGVAIFQILSSALNLYSISPHIVDVLMGAILIFVLLVDYVIKLRKRMVRVKATDAAVKPPVSA
jgi:simple sugar transport system permease protein/ribose transport system permease protein